MPLKIKILPDHVINRIAAGEVVERPGSVVKELIENSIDAGAAEIVVDIEHAGRRLIRVSDNGTGIPRAEACLAFERHATSKITSDNDLEAVRTMGFRGEALASIASVSQVRMLTAVQEAASGTLVEIEAGTVKSVADAAAPRGTSLEIAHLFYNTPARLKFLKSPATEFSHIVAAFSRQALANPSIRFKLTHNAKTVLDLPASQDLRERVFQLYGNEIAENLEFFASSREPMAVRGLVSRPGYSRGDKTYQEFFVNRRAVRNPSLSHALYAACADLLMRDRHPVAFIFIDIEPGLVDVNVHPAKTEVRFRNQSQVHDLLQEAVREGLRGSGMHGRPEAIPGALSTGPHADRVAEAAAEFGSRAGLAAEQARAFHGPAGQKFSFTTEQIPLRGADSDPSLDRSGADFLVPLAQVHDSFIVAQSEKGMTLVDQHAAHERVLFEKLQDQFENATGPVQDLLLPVQLELGPAQSALLAEYLTQFAALGIRIDDFGRGAFIIRSMPALLAGADHKRLVLDMLDEISVHGRSRAFEGLRDGLLSVMACHPAVKVHRKLDIREMERLIADLFKCRMPHTCPHGRPTLIAFSLNDIRKMFKRI